MILAGCVVTVTAAGLLAWDNLIVLAKAVVTIEIMRKRELARQSL